MVTENEVSTEVTAPEVVETPNPAPEAAESADSGDDQPTQAVKEPIVEPELSLREKIQKKAAEVESKRQENAKKPAKTAEKEAPATEPVAAKAGEKAAESAPKDGEKAAFTPNFKLKIMDKDHEIPEFLRGVVKDAETEKQVRELVEKAIGLDYVKPKLEQSRQREAHVTGQFTGLVGQIDDVKGMYARGDIDGWLKRLNVPEERMLQWAADKINYYQLPADQKQIFDARRQAEDRAFNAERQATQAQGQQEQLLHQQVQWQLDSVLARPDVKSVADAFDSRVGKPGSFREEVSRRGDYAWRTRNEIVQPETLVQEMLKLFGPAAPAAVTPASTEAVAPQAAAPAASTSKKAPPVIPNISGRTTSAISTPIKSLDDLRKRSKELHEASSA